MDGCCVAHQAARTGNLVRRGATQLGQPYGAFAADGTQATATWDVHLLGLRSEHVHGLR